MSVVCYPGLGKKKGLSICEAFAAGCGGHVVEPGSCKELRPGPAFFYGWTDDTIKLLQQAQQEKRDWYYADNAYYFGRGKHFRVTKNALMHDGSGEKGSQRWLSFNMPLQPWRHGRHVVVASQSELFYRQRFQVSREQWTAGVVKRIRAHSNKPIEICHKPAPGDMDKGQAHSPALEELLENAWCLVTHSSSAAVAAIIAGVPIFCQAWEVPVARRDLSMVDQPLYPSDSARQQWLCNLAANQWTRDEMRDGTCWRMLHD